jgi:hypothetical protein
MSQLTVLDYKIPIEILQWLQDEIDKVNKRSYWQNGPMFFISSFPLIPGQRRVELKYYEVSSDFSEPAIAAVKELCELAQGGVKAIVTLPAPAASKSVYVGKASEKLSLNVEVYHVHVFNGDFGITFIHKIRDTDGNELVWFSQGKKIEEGHYRMTAKVHKDEAKAFTEYYGTKQTRITHCKFEPREVVKVATSNMPDAKKKPGKSGSSPVGKTKQRKLRAA